MKFLLKNCFYDVWQDFFPFFLFFLSDLFTFFEHFTVWGPLMEKRLTKLEPAQDSTAWWTIEYRVWWMLSKYQTQNIKKSSVFSEIRKKFPLFYQATLLPRPSLPTDSYQIEPNSSPSEPLLHSTLSVILGTSPNFLEWSKIFFEF